MVSLKGYTFHYNQYSQEIWRANFTIHPFYNRLIAFYDALVFYSLLASKPDLENIIFMKESRTSFKLSHQQLTDILTNLLKIPKRNKLIHPCEQRNHYTSVLQWLTTAMAGLLKTKDLSEKQLNDRQQQLMHSTLGQMVEMTRKECLQKSIILEMVQEYLIGTLNAYCQLYTNISREMSYEYEQNTVKMEQSYIEEIKRLQAENEVMRKDKQHRWRNMYMLIKDNRIYRKQNKKLLKSAQLQMEKNANLAEQMILIRGENEKIKLKMGCLEEDGVKIENYVETKLKLIQLERKIQKYPKRCKRILKNQLQRIQINQINGLNDKIIFIIKAIEQTGEIIDQLYDDDVVWTNFHYNISTQTDNAILEEKGVNTAIAKMVHVECETTISQHVYLDYDQTVSVKVKPTKQVKKETARESKNMMFMSATFGSKLGLGARREDKSRRNIDNTSNFSICQSMRITIFHCRISYISTYNTQIFNGKQQQRKISQLETEQIQPQVKQDIPVQTQDAQVQTEPIEEKERPYVGRSYMKNSTKNLIMPIGGLEIRQDSRKPALHFPLHWQIDQVLSHCYDPAKFKHHSRFKSGEKNDKQHLAKPQTNVSMRPSLSQKSGEDKERERAQNNEKKPGKMLMYKQNESDLRFTFKRMTKRVESSEEEEEEEQKNEEEEDKYDEVVISQGKIVRPDTFKEQEISIKEIQPTPPTKNTTKHQSQNIPINSTVLKDIRKQMARKPMSQILSSSFGVSSKSQPKLSRNVSGFASSPTTFKNLQSMRLSKLTSSKQEIHKRATTESSEMLGQFSSNDKIQKKQGITKTRQFKVKALHRISEDKAEIQPAIEEESAQKVNQKQTEKNIQPLTQLKKIQKNVSILPFSLTREGEFVLRQMDFSKGIEKILRNIQTRRNELLNNGYMLKTYLISYFKCLYGKQMYSSFINFLLNSPQTHEVIMCFNRMVNAKLPQHYLVDIFKTFIIMVSKCYLYGESPLASKTNSQILKGMVGMYYEGQQAQDFQNRMKDIQNLTLMGWFNCLEKELRKSALHSELYQFLSSILTEAEDTVTVPFIEELIFFIQADPQLYQHLINAKLFLSARTPIHRLCLFCKRHCWQRLMNIQTTIQSQYQSKLGLYNEVEALKRIMPNLQIIGEFKNLERCLKYWIQCNKKYGQPLNRHLVMLVELNVLEYRLKNQLPLARDLKFICLAFEGLQKKLYYESVKGVGQARERRDGRQGIIGIRDSII